MQSTLLPSDLAQRSEDAYDVLASEYYVSERHPTCANFGAIHDAIIDSLRPLVSGDGTYLEVGCGTGKLDRLRSGDGTVLTDLSGSMLQLARRRTSDGIRCERMDAFSPHFRDGSVRGAFAFLGDAYNHPVFFHRVHQMLVNGGHLVFTIPSHTWATALRSKLQIPLAETIFLHRSGKSVSAPSITRSVEDQAVLLTDVGFRLLSAETFTLEAAPKVMPSHHVVMAAEQLEVDPMRVPLLDVFIATRRD